MTYPVMTTANRSASPRRYGCIGGSGANTGGRNTEILASSIMMISISENAMVENIAYRSASFKSLSCGSIAGWGSEASRTSYKRDLAALGSPSSETCSKQARIKVVSTSVTRSCSSDDWGFYEDDSAS